MTYIQIPDSEFAEGQPARGITMTQLRDNMTAIANGDTGAPRVTTRALTNGAVTFAKLDPAMHQVFGLGTYVLAAPPIPELRRQIVEYAVGQVVSGSAIGIPRGTWLNMGSSIARAQRGYTSGGDASIEVPSRSTPSLFKRIA